MLPTSSASAAISLGIAALVAWRIYSRVRRMIGRQTLSRARLWLTVVFFSLVAVVLGAGSVAHPASLFSLLGGAAVGVGLGWYGLRLTRFEQTPEALYYTPNGYLGIALLLLLLCRLAYRLIEGFVSGSLLSTPPGDLLRNPLTLAVFGAFAGYYVSYAIGLLRWRRHAGKRSAPAVLPPSADA